jgi:Tol biopolymer transport system component
VPGTLAIRDVYRDGRVLLIRQDLRSSVSYVAAGQNRERDVSWLDLPILADASADGSTVLLMETEPGSHGGVALYLRRTDGSPAVRLGDAGLVFPALSPDGKFVLGASPGATPQLVLLPTGAGEPKTLAIENVSRYSAGGWFPEGQRVLIVGSEPGHGPRPYVCPVSGGKPRAIAGEGVAANGAFAISPDGRFLAAAGAGEQVRLYPVEGGEARAAPGAARGDLPLRWTPDGRALYVYQAEGAGAKVYKLDISGGRRELWKEVMPSDPAGVISHGLSAVRLTADGKGTFYNYSRLLSELYVVDGLR